MFTSKAVIATLLLLAGSPLSVLGDRGLAEKATSTKAPVVGSSTKAPKSTKGGSLAPSTAPSTAPSVESLLFSYLYTPGTCPSSGSFYFYTCNDLELIQLNCFTASDFGVSAPFVIDTVRFWVRDGGSTGDMNVVVWVDSDVTGGGPTDDYSPTVTQSVSSWVAGENTVTLDQPITSNGDTACVGLYSTDSSGFRGVHFAYGGLGQSVEYACYGDAVVEHFTDDTFCIEALGYAA